MTSRCKPDTCAGCVLQPHGTDFSAVEGTGANGVLLVGEASGEHEQRDQLPFRPFAPSGGVLERCLRRLGMDRKSFAITNAIRCRPRNNWLENSPHEYPALRHCRPNLDKVIADYRPRVIVALGGIALRELTGVAGDSQGITYLAGYPLPLKVSKQYICETCSGKGCSRCHNIGDYGWGKVNSDIPVIGNFHPSYLRRGKASYQGVFSRILRRATQIAGGKDISWAWGINPADHSTWNTPAGKLDYWCHPSIDQARSFYLFLKDNPNLPVAQDLETSESTSLDEDAREGFQDTHIRLAQFSFQPRTGIALPWVGEYRRIAIDLFHLPNRKFGHNYDNFDWKVLRATAAREGWEHAPANRVHDTLDMFHHWQPDLPAHLQFCASFVEFPFPWKHLAGTNIEFYGIADVDATLQVGLMLEKVLKRDGLWGEGEAYSITYGYCGQEREVRPVLAAMEDRGVPIDDAVRVSLGNDFDLAQKEIGAEIASRAPEGCKRVHPKTGYKTIPPEVRQWQKIQEKITLENELPSQVYQDGAEESYVYAIREFDTDGVKARRICRVYDFNPNSSAQLIQYMKSKGHPVPKSRQEDEEGNRKDTTNKKELQRIAKKTGDDFYLKVIEYREMTKMKGTYIDGFKPTADGRVHTTYTFSTGTAQLSSRNPNTQNIVTHGKLGDAVGRMFAAPSGMILTKWDYKAFHVLTTGFESECDDWMRLARLDMHSFVAGEFLKLWKADKILAESDEELLERFAWFKSDPDRKRVRDKQAKPADLGIGFGMKARRLYQENLEHFASESEAKKFHDILRGVFGKVFAWQDQIQWKAHHEQSLRSKFGHIRRFYEVFRWDGKNGSWGHGDQAEEAVAFLPANHAHSHMREVKKELARAGVDERYGLCNEVHDAFWFCFDEGGLERHIVDVAAILRAPSKVLTHSTLAPVGLWCDAEAAVGKNLTDMKKLKVPDAGTGAVPKSLKEGVYCGQ